MLYHRHVDTGNRSNSALLVYWGFCAIVFAFKGLEISFTKKHKFIRGAVAKHECREKGNVISSIVNAAAEETAVKSYFNFSGSKTELGKIILIGLKSTNFITF